MMTIEELNAFCKALPHTTYVVQWGGAHVWKIGGKIFAVGGWNRKDDEHLSVSFKVSALAFEILGEQAGLRPAPYLASRGICLLYTSPSPRDQRGSRMPSSA